MNLYDYTQITRGPNKGGYLHPKFLKDDRNLCLDMKIRPKTKFSVSSLEARLTEWSQARAQGLQGNAQITNPPLLQQWQQQQNLSNVTSPIMESLVHLDHDFHSHLTSRIKETLEGDFLIFIPQTNKYHPSTQNNAFFK